METARRPRGSRAPSATRATGHVPLIEVVPQAALALHEQLYEGLRHQIVSGRLRPGSRVASTRTLASEVGVSRFTVVTAIERLLAEGYLLSRRGLGTFVANVLPEQLMRPARVTRRRHDAAGTVTLAPPLSHRGRALSAVVITGPRFARSEPRAFRPRRGALDIFPFSTWARLLRRQWRTYDHQLLDYGDPGGYGPLREAIAAHISVARGVTCAARQVIVTSGGQQAFDILFRLLLDPGDRAWIEEPGYLDVRAALVGAGAQLVSVPVDGHGLDVDEGIRRAPDARLAVVSPSHQYPTGVTLSATRRAALLDWARTSGAWLVEDDYDSYFRYRGRPLSALQRFDDDGARAADVAPRVLYVGTFSKTMFPSLRLGFCIVPESLVDAVENARAVADRNSPIADQAALAAFIADGHYDRHLRRLKQTYQERYEAMHASFTRRLQGAVTLSVASAGTHLLGWLDRDIAGRSGGTTAAVRIGRAAAAEDLVIFPLSRYCLERPARDALVLGYGCLTPRRIAAGVERLARVIESRRW
jgi:GntR family transcriptional regulator/MocR family aminotransferase